ncbi:MAG: hypothetical protein ACXV5Q_07750 [Frankiaceae bacterium]
MQVVEPRRGAGTLRLFYKVFWLLDKQRRGILTSLCAIKSEAERINAGIAWHPLREKAFREQHV